MSAGDTLSAETVASRIQAWFDKQNPKDLYPPEVAQQRFENCLLNMLRTPPDPKNVRTKAAARDNRVGKKTSKDMIPALIKGCYSMPEEIRDDAVQHAFLLYRSGKYADTELAAVLKEAKKLAWRDHSGGHYRSISLDQKAFDDGPTTLKDLLRAPDEEEVEEDVT